jgi:hypothetical protein
MSLIMRSKLLDRTALKLGFGRELDLRRGPQLRNHLGQPILQHGPLLGNRVPEGQAHPAVGMAVDHFGLGFEYALVLENPQVNQFSFWEGV